MDMLVYIKGSIYFHILLGIQKYWLLVFTIYNSTHIHKNVFKWTTQFLGFKNFQKSLS